MAPKSWACKCMKTARAERMALPLHAQWAVDEDRVGGPASNLLVLLGHRGPLATAGPKLTSSDVHPTSAVLQDIPGDRPLVGFLHNQDRLEARLEERVPSL